jgi:hypothetical protein
MKNDSIETLLLRHYGNLAPAPLALEPRLLASVRVETAVAREQQQATILLREKRVSRRQIFKLVSPRKVGIGLLVVGLESLQSIESALVSQDSAQPAYS